MKSQIPFRLLYIGSLAASGEKRFLPTLAAAVRGGADAFLLREKALEGRALLDLAREARAITRAAGALLFVSDRFDVALSAEADGVHLPESGFDPRDVRAAVHDHGIRIGRSVHDADGAREAEERGADYLMLGPVHPTPGKRLLPARETGEIVAARGIPTVAVGGITPDRIAPLAAAGFRSFAVIRAIADAADPETAARALREAIEEAC